MSILNPQSLSDYKNHEKYELLYNQRSTKSGGASSNTKYYTLYSQLPSLKDKIILDIPCGIGCKARNAVLKDSASKVIAIDIFEEQISYSKTKDKQLGIEPGQIEYFAHDCKIPRKFTDQPADICICIHLFCFAQTYQELLGFAKCIHLNLKKGAELHILICSMGKNPEMAKKLKLFEIDLVELAPWLDNSSEPRKLHMKYRDFNYSSLLWEYQTLSNALKETGFTDIELIPYTADPDYTGNFDLELYNKINDGFIVKAIKG